jgi:hypothetical protein
MKIRMMLAFSAIGLGTAFAGGGDPPGYARALIGHVLNVLPEGLVVQGVNESQIHPEPGPGVDHECFAGIGGIVLVRGVQTPYKAGEQIEIMVTLSDDKQIVTIDPSHPLQVDVCDRLAESLAFGVGVDWDPSKPATPSPSLPVPSLAVPAPASPGGGSIDDPIPGSPK